MFFSFFLTHIADGFLTHISDVNQDAHCLCFIMARIADVLL